MTPERWRQVQELFGAVADLPREARSARLAEACGDDAELRREVESLLASSADASDFLEGGALRELTGPGPERQDEPPRRIGPYEIVRELGHGGMGTVYLGARSEDFEKRVAIKVVRRGMDTELILRRFREERQILAGLDHPYIARLFDGGTTGDGVPYFVMEHVEGETLLAFCDARRLATAERVRLFRRVCEAVQHAHAQLIVHRDLKPSNILVKEDGTPKLLDFGIARVLMSEGSAEAATAHTALRLMTTDYASPEQVRGERVTTASDVYSLGVVLYALLTGRPPYRLKTSQPEELQRAVCESEPERPSKVRRGLSADLDAIVLKALRKEPDRRYGSVEQLSEDLRRHLEGLPVSARRGTLSYRSSRFVRRHAVGLATAAAVLALVAGLVAFYTERLRRERDHARLEAEKATQVAAFLSGVFELSDPDRSKGEKLTARDLLDRGAARIERDLAAQPAVRASMTDLLGTVYFQLGLHREAQALLERSLALRERSGTPRELAASLVHLGLVHHSAGRYAQALPHFQRALAIQESTLGRDDLDVALTLNNLANLKKATGRLPLARRLFERALAIEDHASVPNLTATAKTLNNLGVLVQREGDLAGARRLFERALRLHERAGGPDNPLLAAPLSNFADVLRAQKDFAAALPLQLRHLALVERLYGGADRNVAVSLNSLASTYNDTGDYATAAPLYERAIRVYETALGPEHADLAYPVKNLGNLYMAKGDTLAALPLYQRALQIRRKALGPEHVSIAQSLMNLGSAEERLGHAAAAERLFVDALAMDRRVLAAGHRGLCDPLLALGRFWSGRRDRRRAEPLLVEAVDIRRKTQAPGSAMIAEAEESLRSCRLLPIS